MLKHLEKAKNRLECDKDIVSFVLNIFFIALKVRLGSTEGDPATLKGCFLTTRGEGV